jgi:elongation factor G
VYLLEQDRLVGLITGDHTHEEQRGTLIEGVIEESEDETLMERYVGGEEVDAKLLVEDLERAVARGSFHPVVPVDSSTGLGARELLDLVVAGFPAPAEHLMLRVLRAGAGSRRRARRPRRGRADRRAVDPPGQGAATGGARRRR